MAADHLTSQLKELREFLSAGNEESAKRLIETLNPLSVVDVEKVDFTKLPKDILGTSIIPDIDDVNETGHRIALQVTGNGNCLYNSASLILCGDESRSNSLRLLVQVNFIFMPSITRLMKYLNKLQSLQKFQNRCYFRLL